jgi:hypothetical protein
VSDSRPTRDVETNDPARRMGWRSMAAALCVVLAALLTTPVGVAFWGQRTLNDGQRYLDTVGPLVSSPQVQDAIATKAIDGIEKQVDVEAIPCAHRRHRGPYRRPERQGPRDGRPGRQAVNRSPSAIHEI